MPIMLFVILALVFVILLIVITNIVIVPAVHGLRHRAAGQLLRQLERRPAPQDPVRGAGGQEGQPEGAGRGLPAPARHHQGQRHHADRHRGLSSRSPTPSSTPTASSSPSRAIENLSATTLRNIIGELELDQYPHQPRHHQRQDAPPSWTRPPTTGASRSTVSS